MPADGFTHVVMRWGNTPADLDVYVVPIGVRDKRTSKPVTWGAWDTITGNFTFPGPTVSDGQVCMCVYVHMYIGHLQRL